MTVPTAEGAVEAAAAPILTRRAEFWAGARATLPLVIGAIPFAIIFGAVAIAKGLSPFTAQGMSLTVFAGSAQFIATSMAGDEAIKTAGIAGALVIVFTTLIVNLRHALYSATLGPYVKHIPQRMLALMGFTLTDETFVISIARFQKHDASPYKHWYYIGSALIMYCNWQLSTLVGIALAQAVSQEQLLALGLDFAASATFIGMLIPLVTTRPAFLAILTAGAASVAFYGLPYRLGLIIAAILGVIVGVLADNQLRNARGGSL